MSGKPDTLAFPAWSHGQVGFLKGGTGGVAYPGGPGAELLCLDVVQVDLTYLGVEDLAFDLVDSVS